MSTAPRKQPFSVAEYLAGELGSNKKHEFVDGLVYAMVGGPTRHNRIATNATGSLYVQLREKPCEVFNSDMKVRIRQSRSTRFYYPDLAVVCQTNADEDSFQDHAMIVVEVLSDSTRRVDEFEKRDAYLSINSLNCYLLLEQNAPSALVYRRTDDGFEREYYEGLDAIIPLSEIDCQLNLAEVYLNVTFPEPTSGEDD